MLSQLAISTVVMLNKTDLVETDEIDRIEAEIINLNPLAKIHRCSFSNIDLKVFYEKDISVTEQIHKLEEHECKQLKGMENIVVRLKEQNKTIIDKLIGQLLWVENEGKDYEIVRLKGVFTDEEGLVCEVQGIHDLYEVTQSGKEKEVEGKLLVIGKNLKKNRDLISKFFN